MVVAAGAAERQSEEGSPDRIDLLVDNVHLHLGFINFSQHFGADRQKAGRNQLLVPLGLVGGGQQIACQLLGEEAVVCLIAIEGGDDVIAVTPGVAMGHVFIEAVGVCVAGHVEPVPAPPLTIGRRS